MNEAVNLKKEAFLSWLSQWIPEAADMDQEARRAEALAVDEPKMWLQKGNQGLAQAEFTQGGELLTWTGDIIRQWKEHFEELLNLTNMSPTEESEDFGEDSSISLQRLPKRSRSSTAARFQGWMRFARRC